jgi:hypothetical protein
MSQRAGVKQGRKPNGQFPPGVSGNPGGRPKGLSTYRFLKVIEAAMDAKTEEEAVKAFRGAIGSGRQVLAALQTGGRFTREIGADSDDAARPVHIHLHTNIDPGKLRGATG